MWIDMRSDFQCTKKQKADEYSIHEAEENEEPLKNSLYDSRGGLRDSVVPIRPIPEYKSDDNLTKNKDPCEYIKCVKPISQFICLPKDNLASV